MRTLNQQLTRNLCDEKGRSKILSPLRLPVSPLVLDDFRSSDSTPVPSWYPGLLFATLRPMPTWTGTWDGGRTYQTSKGQTVYVIRKSVPGLGRFQVVLQGIDTVKQARVQLARFDEDPAAYVPPAKVRAAKQAEKAERERQEEQDAVRLDGDSTKRYFEAPSSRGGIKDRTPRYRADVKRYLKDWGEALAGRDLRSMPPREMLRILGRWTTAEQKRIAAIKAFCSWLVATGQLDPAQDPTRAMTVPASKPEKALREKGYEMAFVEKLYAGVDEQSVRDVLCLHAKLGMHDSEVRRIVTGECEFAAVDGHKLVKGTIRFKHKSGRVHTVSCDAQTMAAARRLKGLKEAPSPDRVRWVLGAAAEAEGLLKRPVGSKSKRPPSVNLGELRHSFVAWALESGEAVTVSGKGVPLALVTSVLGHTNTFTTKKFYDVSKVPPMVRLPLKLEHARDPLP